MKNLRIETAKLVFIPVEKEDGKSLFSVFKKMIEDFGCQRRIISVTSDNSKYIM